MRINRNIAISLAISALLGGLIGWLVSSDDQPTQIQPNSALTASATPTPTDNEEPTEIFEDPNPNALPARNIWTYDCEIPVQLPESIFLTCADGGWYIYQIKWQSWDESEATATGYFSQKVCEPDCASGYRVEAPVELIISTSAKAGKKIFLTDLVMSATTEKDFKSGDRTLTWDLGEFAKMMDSE
jgi:hypothetical protein